MTMIYCSKSTVFRPVAGTALDRAVATEFFGWRWLAFNGIPTRNHPDYPGECVVRRFFPPDDELHEAWAGWFAEHPTHPATGDEPLHYSYCSSNAPLSVPAFSDSLEAARVLEKRICKLGLWNEYEIQLAVQCKALRKNGNIDLRKWHFATSEQRCIAALAVVGSKYVTNAANA